MEIVDTILRILLQAQRCAQVHHWQTRSFAQHIALGELYDAISEKLDEIAEIYTGIAGQPANPAQSDPNGFSQQNPIEFVQQLYSFLASVHDQVPADGGLLTVFEELQSKVSRAKYKLERFTG